MSYIPVTIQRMDRETETWTDWLHLHAIKVNRAGGGEAYRGEREQYQPRLLFELHWCSALEALRWDPMSHRIVYQGHTLNIVDYDDFMERHINIRLTGEAYG